MIRVINELDNWDNREIMNSALLSKISDENIREISLLMSPKLNSEYITVMNIISENIPKLM